MQSECLKETFAELDLTSDVLEVAMSPTHPHFRLGTYGYAGNTQVSVSMRTGCLWGSCVVLCEGAKMHRILAATPFSYNLLITAVLSSLSYSTIIPGIRT